MSGDKKAAAPAASPPNATCGGDEYAARSFVFANDGRSISEYVFFLSALMNDAVEHKRLIAYPNDTVKEHNIHGYKKAS